MTISVSQTGRGIEIVVVGPGGNIGSQLTSHLARMPGVDRIVLIDPGVYDQKDIWGQAITPREVGQPKAMVQARRLRAIRRDLRVRSVIAPIESVPLGLLRGRVILACLDSRVARLALNEAAWRLNVPFIDAGVAGSGLLARVNVYVPGAENPCLECAWSAKDYEQVEQVYPCQVRAAQSAPTNAPSALGGLAASLEALECRKLLAGLMDRVLVSRQVVLDAMFHKHYVTSFSRSDRCRFDHDVWRIEQLRYSETLSLQDVLSLGIAASGGVRVAGSHFVRALTCAVCGHRRTLLRLEASLRPADLKCRHCGGPASAPAFDRLDRLDPAALPPRVIGKSLRSLGLRDHDVISVVGAQGEKHYELVSDGAPIGTGSRAAGESQVDRG